MFDTTTWIVPTWTTSYTSWSLIAGKYCAKWRVPKTMLAGKEYQLVFLSPQSHHSPRLEKLRCEVGDVGIVDLPKVLVELNVEDVGLWSLELLNARQRPCEVYLLWSSILPCQDEADHPACARISRANEHFVRVAWNSIQNWREWVMLLAAESIIWSCSVAFTLYSNQMKMAHSVKRLVRNSRKRFRLPFQPPQQQSESTTNPQLAPTPNTNNNNHNNKNSNHNKQAKKQRTPASQQCSTPLSASVLFCSTWTIDSPFQGWT